jgi:hypothetical protein
MEIDLENPFALKVRTVIEDYARQAANPELLAVCDPKQLIYVLLHLPFGAHSENKIFAIVRVVANWVIIDEDQTSASLVDSFIRDGIEREKIILSYAGESLPDLNSLFASLLKREVNLYVGYSPDAIIYPVLDDERQTYAVIHVPNDPKSDERYVINMAHLVDDKIVIDEDRVLDKPLYEALIWNAGIPRSRIILAYVGEILLDIKSE